MRNAKKSQFTHGKTVPKLVLALLIFNGSINAQMFWNHAAKFEGGTNSYIACPNTLAINIVGSLTVEAWVRPETSTGTRYIIFKGSAGAGYYLRINSNGTVTLGTNGVNRITSTDTVPSGKWTHIAGSYDVNSDVFKIYVNGQEDGSVISNNPPATSTDSLLIGKFGANSFRGMIDEVRIWTKAVTSANIRRNMRTSLTLSSGQYVSLLLSMPFQRMNSTGTVFSLSDLSMNPISITNGINRGITGVNLGSAPSEYLSNNEALQFEGNNNSYAAIPSNGLIDLTGAMTLEAWIMPGGSSGVNQYIIHKHNAGIGLRFMLNSSQKLSFSLNTSTFYEGSTTLSLNKWYHAAWVISATGASSLYIDGVLDAYFAGTGSANSNNDSMYIGRGFNGLIDEIRVFKYERTPEEIRNYMNVSIDESNKPAGVGFSFNLDGSAWANSNFQLFFLRGNTFFSAPATTPNIFSPPLIRADNMNFQQGFYKKSGYRRIPESGSVGAMIEDSIVIPDNVSITDLNVFISLNHGEANELDIHFISPSGQDILLMDGFSLFGSSSNLTTIFDDQADSSLNTNRYVHISPKIKPTSAINSALSGSSSQGVWRLRINDAAIISSGHLMSWGIQLNNSPVIGLQNISNEVPDRFSLAQNYPNPFNPVTNIGFQIADLGFVTMKLFDITGKQVAVLVNEELKPRAYNVDFDGSNLSSGTYFYRIDVRQAAMPEGRQGSSTNGFTDVKKMVLVK